MGRVNSDVKIDDAAQKEHVFGAIESRMVCEDIASPKNQPPIGCDSAAVPQSKELLCQASGTGASNFSSSRVCRHAQVPRNVDLAKEYNNSNSDQQATTLMIRNIPNRCTQRGLIKTLEGLGFVDTFDFLYLPVDRGTLTSVGYAFVNFVTAAHAERCFHVLQNYSFKKHCKGPEKFAAVSYAHLQGLEANLAHYEKAAISTAKSKKRRPWLKGTSLSTLE
jgi:hypothetical protein